MLGRVVVENGVKKIVPLTADCGSGNPVGTVIAVYSNKVPNGYLPCNGVAFDTAQFPVLYALLGDDHTPDLRECTLVGIGQSDRAVGAHDVYTVGEFKDDQFQQHDHDINPDQNIALVSRGQATQGSEDANIGNSYNKKTGNVSTGRTGTTTHGKQVGVNWCIKATSGINENQVDNVLSALSPVDTVTSGDMHSVTSNAVYSIKEKTEKMYVDNQLDAVRNLPNVPFRDLPSQSTDDNVYFKEWFDWMYNHNYFDRALNVYIGQANPNYQVMVWGFTYEAPYQWSLFYYMKPDNPMGTFGYRNGAWFCGEADTTINC